VIAALDAAKIIGLRAGLGPHRFLGVWVVVVDGRAFVRPWNDKPHGWYRAFLEDPRGVLQVAERELPIRMSRARGERLMDAIDAAYAAKYPTPGSRQYVRGFKTPRRRATTLEIKPR
jgi:hypothetical protein